MAAMTRHVRFENIDNFRDFGDYAAGPRRLKRGLLYRSAHQGRASDADLEKLAGLGLAVIVDLRRANEREREPSRRWSGFDAQVIENDIGQDSADEWGTFIAGSDLTVASFRNYMLDYYRHAPFQRRHIDLYRRYFQNWRPVEDGVELFQPQAMTVSRYRYRAPQVSFETVIRFDAAGLVDEFPTMAERVR